MNFYITYWFQSYKWYTQWIFSIAS